MKEDSKLQVMFVSQEDALQHFEGNSLEKLKAIVKKTSKVKVVPGDDKTFEDAQKACRMLVKLRRKIDSRRKDLTKPARDHINVVNSVGKKLISVIQPEENRLKTEISTEKERRQRKIKELQEQIKNMREAPSRYLNASPEEIAQEIDRLKEMEITEETFGDYWKEATDERAMAISVLSGLYEKAVLVKEKEHEKESGEDFFENLVKKTQKEIDAPGTKPVVEERKSELNDEDFHEPLASMLIFLTKYEKPLMIAVTKDDGLRQKMESCLEVIKDILGVK